MVELAMETLEGEQTISEVVEEALDDFLFLRRRETFFGEREAVSWWMLK
jgi:hypothetical protein